MPDVRVEEFVIRRRTYRFESPYMVDDGCVWFSYVKQIGTWFEGGPVWGRR